MRPLIVLGATPAMQKRLQDWDWTGHITFTDDVEEAFDLTDEHPRAVLAYGPETFGAAVTAQPSRIYTSEPQVLLTDGVGDDGKTHAPQNLWERAARALRVNLVLNTDKDSALDALAKALDS
jgi:hypothetical protein